MKEFITDITEVAEIDDQVLLSSKKVNDKIQKNWRLRKVLSIAKNNFEPLMNLEFFNPYLKRIESMCHYQLIFQQFEEDIALNRRKTVHATQYNQTLTTGRNVAE